MNKSTRSTRSTSSTRSTLTLLALALLALPLAAKLPAPNDEAKAKAAEAAAKTAHGNKVADFQLCKSMDRVAVSYRDTFKKAGKDVKAATETPACADPGPFVYTPPAPAAPGAAPATPGAAPAAAATTTAAAGTAAKPAASPAPAAAPAKK